MVLKIATYKESDRLQHAMSSGQFMTKHRKLIHQMKSETNRVAKTALFFTLGSNATQKDTHVQIKEKKSDVN